MEQATISRVRQQLEAAMAHAPIRQDSDACAECGGRGWIRDDEAGGVRRCECRRLAIIAGKLGEIPERFRQCTFQNYVPADAKQSQAHCRIMGNFLGSFYLHGDYARGKTHLATAQYRKLIDIEQPCMFLSMGELLAELRKSEMDADYFCLVRQRARHSDRFHLFLDDIDKFKSTDFKTEVLFDLFDTIYKRKLGITITSNCSLADLRVIHPSIVRRIDDTCAAIEV